MPKFDDIIEKHAKRVGLDPEWMKKVMRIESGGDPTNVTGRYHGLFQLDEQEFRAGGGTGSRFDPEQNTMAAANLFARQGLAFKERYGRDIKPIDRYMIHQQGAAGYSAHLANPDKPAWENIRQYYKSDEMAKKAIWGNIPDRDKAKFGSVENVTSQQFVGDVWGRRIEGGEPEFGGVAMAGARHRARGEADPKIAFLEGKERKETLLGFEELPMAKWSGLQVPDIGPPRFKVGI
jgi:Transglycosylase SLT domain